VRGGQGGEERREGEGMGRERKGKERERKESGLTLPSLQKFLRASMRQSHFCITSKFKLDDNQQPRIIISQHHKKQNYKK